MQVRYALYSLALSAIFIALSATASASQITVAWDRCTDPNIAGYYLYYGIKSGNYQYKVKVGNYNSCAVSGLENGKTYYFAATAYDSQLNESAFSEEIEYTTPSTVKQLDPAVYISDITINLLKKGSKYHPKAYVTVWDEMDRIVEGAVVSGQWFLNGKYVNEGSSSTDRKGMAKLISNKINASSGGELTFRITNIAKYGYRYDFTSDIVDESSANLK